MANPVFAQLTRAWGLSVRFVGIDREGLAYDFRELLTDRTLKLLVELLDVDRSDEPGLLDALFAALGREMLTILERRAAPAGAGTSTSTTASSPRLMTRSRARRATPTSSPNCARPCTTRSSTPRSTGARAALDRPARGRVRAARGCADRVRARAGDDGRQARAHEGRAPLGLLQLAAHLDPHHAAARAHVLGSLPGLATFFAETLVPIFRRCGSWCGPTRTRSIRPPRQTTLAPRRRRRRSTSGRWPRATAACTARIGRG